LASGCVGLLCWFLFGAITKKLHAQGRLSVPNFVNYTTLRLTLLTISFSGRPRIIHFEADDAVRDVQVLNENNEDVNNNDVNNENDENVNNENNDVNNNNNNNNDDEGNGDIQNEEH